MGVTVIRGAGGDSIVVQDQWFPVVCSTWRASPSLVVIEQYFDWLNRVLDRAQREGLAVVNITDAGLAGLPDADVRRMIAERTKEVDFARAPKGFRAITVVESSVIRGVMNALAWMHGDMQMKNTTVASRKDAIDQAQSWLRSIGITPPLELAQGLLERPNAAR